MNHYVTGKTIRELREKKGYTQKQLGERLSVSDKTISKWETQKGLPDVSMLEPLAKELGVSLIELMSGESIINQNSASKLSRSSWYVCPICGNVIFAIGEGIYSCCGILLPVLEVEEADDEHAICIDHFENETIVSLNHPMTKEHYISFIAFVTLDRSGIKKLYAQQDPQAEFLVRGHGYFYVYCNRHGLYRYKI